MFDFNGQANIKQNLIPSRNILVNQLSYFDQETPTSSFLGAAEGGLGAIIV